MTTFPPIDAALLAALETAFPDRVPNETDTDRAVWRKSGNVQVVRFLRAHFEAQNDAEDALQSTQVSMG